MESLQALLITRDLERYLPNADIAVSTVYTNPTASALTTAISELSRLSRQSQVSYQQTRQQVIDMTLKKHKSSIDSLVDNSQTKSIKSNATRFARIENHTVILTGSTGALGSYLLEVLLKTSSVSHVYCLDRASASSSTRPQRNRARKVASAYLSNRVTFLTADISQQGFGLEAKEYETLLAQATSVIHNAWPVNFNLPLSAFGPQLVGITRLVDFAVSATQSPIIFFISSISSVLDYRGNSLSIREEIISDINAPSSMGYGESKYLAEVLLDYASKTLSIDTRVARVGQIAGPVKVQYIWNEWEWLPSLNLSSLHVGAVQDSLGTSQNKIDWVPIDLLAEILVELTLNIDRQKASTLTQPEEPGKERLFHLSNPHSITWRSFLPTLFNTLSCSNIRTTRRITSTVTQPEKPGKTRVFHPLNPHPVAWKSLLPIIVDTLNCSNARTKRIDIVPFEAWLHKVRVDAEAAGSADVGEMLRVNPAAKLLDFYEKLAQDKKTDFATSKTEEASSKMRAIGAIKPEWFER